EAEPLLRQTLELLAKNLPPDHQYVASAEHYLGETLLATGQLKDAEEVLTSAMNRWTRTGSSAWGPARSPSAPGEVFDKQGRTEEAERYLTTSYRQMVADPNTDPGSKRLARERITKFYTEHGQKQKLEAFALETR